MHIHFSLTNQLTNHYLVADDIRLIVGTLIYGRLRSNRSSYLLKYLGQKQQVEFTTDWLEISSQIAKCSAISRTKNRF